MTHTNPEIKTNESANTEQQNHTVAAALTAALGRVWVTPRTPFVLTSVFSWSQRSRCYAGRWILIGWFHRGVYDGRHSSVLRLQTTGECFTFTDRLNSVHLVVTTLPFELHVLLKMFIGPSVLSQLNHSLPPGDRGRVSCPMSWWWRKTPPP